MARVLPEDELRTFLRRRRRLTAPLDPPPTGKWLVETLRLAAKLVPCGDGVLLLNDPTLAQVEPELTVIAGFGKDGVPQIGRRITVTDGLRGEVYRSGKTVRVEGSRAADAELRSSPRGPIRSRLVTPVRLERTISGLFELSNRRGRPAFTERDVEMAEMLADYLARTILNAVDILKQNELALYDELTGLRNTRGLETFLEQSVEAALRDGGDVAVLFLDVDRLKRVNDKLGHRAGSEALRRVARVVAEVVGDRGMPFRFGGDEFVVICPVMNLEDGQDLATRLLTQVVRETPGPLADGAELPAISVSAGVASLRVSTVEGNGSNEPPSGRAARILTRADQALFRAKRSGRGRIVLSLTPDDDDALDDHSGTMR